MTTLPLCGNTLPSARISSSADESFPRSFLWAKKRRYSASLMVVLTRMGSMLDTVSSSVASPLPTRLPGATKRLPIRPLIGDLIEV